ncbi:MAG: FecR family protein [Bacteroidales bacterium]
MRHSHNYTKRDWKELAARLSGEETNSRKEPESKSEMDALLEKYWKAAAPEKRHTQIDVNSAWNKLQSKILESETVASGTKRMSYFYLRIAAAILLIIGIGTSTLYLLNVTGTGKNIVVATGEGDKNKEVNLPDGSKVWLNRNSEITYPKNSWKNERKVKLTGEGYFEIITDSKKPFSVDAGKAVVKVVGTSFNVITNNPSGEVEVYVESGTVMLSDERGSSILLEPGYIGTTNEKTPDKKLNSNRNYMAWRTELLVYEGTRLSDVFSDLNRAYDINIYARDNSILEKTITATFDNEPPETIIRIICTTFNLSFEKDGNLFRLSEK